MGLVIYRLFQPIYTTMEKYVTLGIPFIKNKKIDNARAHNLSPSFSESFKYFCPTLLQMLAKNPKNRPS